MEVIGTCADVVPFRIEVPEEDLADLRQRLGRTRWPEPA
jgi:Epoxide hydrolase N terminus